MSRGGRFVVLGSLAGLAATLAACSAILGFETLTLHPSDAGASDTGSPVPAAGDGGTAADASLADASGGGDGALCVANLTEDAKHCGRCNHDCLGGGCSASKCQPLKLADGLAIPEGLVVDDTSVFVAELDQNRILKFGKNALGSCTSAPQPVDCYFSQANVFQPTAMGIDATSVYWANTGGGTTHEIRSCPRAGCGAQAANVIANLGVEAFGHLFGDDVLPLELIVEGGQVFWPESLGGAIRSAPVTGGGAVTTYLESGDFMPLAIALDGTRIFFTDDTNQHPTQIQAVPRDGTAQDGGAVEVIAATPSRPYGLGLSPAGNLYWTVPFIGAEGDGLVQTAAKTSDGGAPIGAIASSLIEPHALIVDASFVYWVLPGDYGEPTGFVVYCPLSGCPSTGPIILAKNQRQPRHLTQDGNAIYWSNEGLPSSSAYDGQVWKVAKP